MTDEALFERLQARVNAVRTRIASACARVGRDENEVTLVAVTKTVSSRVIAMLSQMGILDCGENRPQALWQKAHELRHLPLRWHLIGHLQRNKVDRTWPLLHAFHGADSLRILQAIPVDSSTSVFLQVNASGEEQKHGFDFDELLNASGTIATLPIRLRGLMTMAAYDDDPEKARPAFAALRALRERLRGKLELDQLSMGMSGDFEVAIEEGSTHIRVGTTLFEGLGRE